MSITKKIVALVAVLALFTAATAVAYHRLVARVRDMATAQTTDMLRQDYRNELKDLVDAMAPTLAAAAAGVKDEAEVYRVFNGLVKDARFFPDRSGYYFIYKAGGTVFVLSTLRDLEGALGDRQAAVAREITKIHEEIAQGRLSELAERFAGEVRGEVTLVVAGPPQGAQPQAQEDLDDEIRRRLAAGEPPTQIARGIARARSLARREVYARVEALKRR